MICTYNRFHPIGERTITEAFTHAHRSRVFTRAAPTRLTSSGRSKKHASRGKLLALERIPLLLSLKHSKMRLKVDEAIQAAQDAAQSALHIADIATARFAQPSFTH